MINVLMLLLALPCFTVWLIDQWFKSQNSFLVCSGAYPNSTQAIQSTHYFQICVVAQPLTQLLIEIPDLIGITNQVTIIDQQFRMVEFVSDTTFTNVTIKFTQPIMPGQFLSIAIHGIQSPARSPRTWVYHLYGRHQDCAFKLLGIARVSTYC